MYNICPNNDNTLKNAEKETIYFLDLFYRL